MKIGRSGGNPDGLLYSVQAELAARTLFAEIKTYKPTIVVFVTGTYGSPIIYQATETSKKDWMKTEEDPAFRNIDTEVYWIPRNENEGTPAYLWTPHPSRGILVERRQFWARAAKLLSEGATGIADAASTS